MNNLHMSKYKKMQIKNKQKQLKIESKKILNTNQKSIKNLLQLYEAFSATEVEINGDDLIYKTGSNATLKQHLPEEKSVAVLLH